MTTVLRVLAIAAVALAAAAPAGAQGWTQQSTGTTLVLYEIRMINADSATAVGQSGVILQTTDGGASWLARTSNTTTNLFSVEYADQSIGVVVGDNGVMRRTIDAGQTWSVLPAITTDNLRGISFTDGTTGTVVGTNGAILRSTNAGANWTPVRGVAATLYEASFVTPDTGWVVGAGGTILKTTDGGATWVQQTSGTGATLYGVSFADVSTGTAVGTSGIIRRTTNGGASWFSQTSHVSTVLTSVQMFSPTAACAVGDGGVILRTSNAGVTWTAQASGTVADLKEVSFVDENVGMISGTGGTILRTTTGGYSTATLALSSPNGGESFRINDTITVAWNASGFTTADISLTRDNGTSWETLATGVPAGSGSYSWVVTGPVSSACRVRVSATGNPALSDASNGVFSILPAIVTRTYGYLAGWNLVSVPLAVADYAPAAVFPSASSEPFRFDTAAGYVPVTTLAPGVGYWLKFDAPASIPITGVPRASDTAFVGSGWNLIGTVSDPFPTASIVTIPAGIVESAYYGFGSAGYEPVATLTPGQAYWVKCTQPGRIILSTN